MKKKILMVYPHNFLKPVMGVDSRFLELVRYFNVRDMECDVLTLKNFVSNWNDTDYKQSGLIQELHFFDFAAGYEKWAKKQGHALKRLLFSKKRKEEFSLSELPDYAFSGMKKQFAEIIEKKNYDFILISYVFWANLLCELPLTGITTVLTIEDFLTLNLFESASGNVKLGNLFEEEIRRINCFHKVICISNDELQLFSKFAPGPDYFYVPFFMKERQLPPHSSKTHDILFIGSDNPFNQKGIAWFFENVYPLLSRGVRILVVGKITHYVPEHPNVTRMPFAADLSTVYSAAKLSICPMFGGTGLKIKVIEALSYGLPVVSTPDGITGFPDKRNNGCLVADNGEDFAATISRLLTEPDEYSRQARLAKTYFLENFEETKGFQVLDAVFFSEGAGK